MKQFVSIITLCFLIACNSRPKTLIAASKAVEIDKQRGECPYLTKDSKGNTVLSWVRMINDSTTAFCYAVSNDGSTFPNIIVIPNTDHIKPHGENLPKIIFKPSGEIIALWGTANANEHNKYSGLVSYTQSFDNGKTWTNPKPLVSDTASYDQRYYDVAILPDGEAGIIWLDNRKTTSKEGSALYFVSTSGQDGFQREKMISESCCQCCRTVLHVDKKGSIHALYRGIIQDSIRDMMHIVSADRGQSFSTAKRISEDNWVLNGCPHTGPSMTDNKEGVHFAWFTGGNKKGCRYTKSTDDGKSFIMNDSVTGSGSHPQMISMPNGELVIVWDESSGIGIERRTSEGRTEATEKISAGERATYPVISATGDHKVLVAYSVKKANINVVAYQVVKLE